MGVPRRHRPRGPGLPRGQVRGLPLGLGTGRHRGPVLHRHRRPGFLTGWWRRCARRGFGPGENASEFGSTWFNLMRSPDEAAHLLGKLLLTVGKTASWGAPNHLVRVAPGPDRRLPDLRHLPPRFQDRFGYPALTDRDRGQGVRPQRGRVLRPRPGHHHQAAPPAGPGRRYRPPRPRRPGRRPPSTTTTTPPRPPPPPPTTTTTSTPPPRPRSARQGGQTAVLPFFAGRRRPTLTRRPTGYQPQPTVRAREGGHVMDPRSENDDGRPRQTAGAIPVGTGSAPAHRQAAGGRRHRLRHQWWAPPAQGRRRCWPSSWPRSRRRRPGTGPTSPTARRDPARPPQAGPGAPP